MYSTKWRLTKSQPNWILGIDVVHDKKSIICINRYYTCIRVHNVPLEDIITEMKLGT